MADCGESYGSCRDLMLPSGTPGGSIFCLAFIIKIFKYERK
jgi:hypothetical protein